MIYKFNGRDITTYGVLPLQVEGGVALSGMFDLPKRIGETERNWGDRIEPYVDAEDIRLGDRTIGLKVVMADLKNWEAFRQACLECRILETEWGDYNVLIADEIQVERAGERMGLIGINFLQTDVRLPELTLPSSGGSGYRIDEFNLEKDFGIQVSGMSGDLDVPKRIDVGTTAPYQETGIRTSGTITLECRMQAERLHIIAGRIGQLHALCMSPGMRMLYFPDGRSRQVYVKDGIKVKLEDQRLVNFNIKMQTL